MKTNLFLFVILLSVWSCSSPNHLTEAGLKGKVKKVTTTTYTAKERFGEIQKVEKITSQDRDHILNMFPKSEIEYDKNGFMTKRTNFDENDEIISLSKCEYKEGVETSSVFYNSDGSLLYSEKYVYNDEQPIDLVYEGPFEIKTKDAKFEDGKLMSVVMIEDSVEMLREQTYNEHNQVLETVFKGHDIVSKVENTWSEEGQLLVRTSTYEREEMKNVNTLTYEYDQDGNVVKLTYEAKMDDTPTEKVEYTYDYQHYEGKGNWDKCLIYRNGEPYVIQEREIEYY